MALLTLSALVQATPLAAQTIAGTVRDAATSAPVRGAFVEVVDSAGQRVAAALSDSLGRVRFEVEPGASRLRVEAAGYADAAIPFVLAPGEERALELELPPRPLGLTVGRQGAVACRLAADTGGAVYGIWIEVEKLLRLASWSMREAGLTLLARTFERTTGLGATTAVRQANPDRVWLDTIEGAPVYKPVTLIGDSAGASDRNGKVALDVPTPESLRAHGFAAEHCFVARRAEGVLALEFSPAHPGLDGGVRGTVWLDRDARALQRIDFSWKWGQPGGRGADATYEFTRTPEGYSIVGRWLLRLRQPGGWVKAVGAEVVQYWPEEP